MEYYAENVTILPLANAALLWYDIGVIFRTYKSRRADRKGTYFQVKKALKIILSVLLVIVLIAGAAIWYFMTQLTKDAVPIVEVPDESAETETTEAVEDFTVEIEVTPTPEPTEDPNEITEEKLVSMTVEQDALEEPDLGIKQVDQINENVINVLLVGADVRRLNAYSTANADTIMMASINKSTKVITLVSFMRDSYIQIRGLKGNVSMNKLNSAYANGGMGWLINTLNYKGNYNLDIQYYLGVGFRNFEKLIDAIGGVDVELTAEECYYINWRCAELLKTDPKDNRKELLAEQGKAVLDEVAGTHHLTGLQTLWYARDRTTGEDAESTGSDFTRTSRQQEVLQLVYNKVKSGLTLVELANLAKFTMENSYTNIKFAKLCEIGLFLLNNDVTVQTITMPRDKSWAYESVSVKEGSAPVEVVTFKVDPNRKYLHELLYGELLKAATPEPTAAN